MWISSSGRVMALKGQRSQKCFPVFSWILLIWNCKPWNKIQAFVSKFINYLNKISDTSNLNNPPSALRTPKFPKLPKSFSNLTKIPQSTSKQGPLYVESIPKLTKVPQSTPKFPQSTTKVPPKYIPPKYPKYTEIPPKYPHSTPNYPKVHQLPQSTPRVLHSTRKVLKNTVEYPKVSQSTLKWLKVLEILAKKIWVLSKVHIFWEGHKILQNIQKIFDWQYIGQIIGGDFAKFCGLLRIYEL